MDIFVTSSLFNGDARASSFAAPPDPIPGVGSTYVPSPTVVMWPRENMVIND